MSGTPYKTRVSAVLEYLETNKSINDLRIAYGGGVGRWLGDPEILEEVSEIKGVPVPEIVQLIEGKKTIHNKEICKRSETNDAFYFPISTITNSTKSSTSNSIECSTFL